MPRRASRWASARERNATSPADPLAIVPAAAAPRHDGQLVCGQRARGVVILHLVFLAFSGFLALPVVFDLPLAAVIACLWFGGWGALLAMLTHSSTRGALSDTAWRLRAGPEGMAVNLRSYRNYHFDPSDPTALLLPRQDVKRIALSYRNMRTPGVEVDDPDNRHAIATLEITLNRDSLPEVKAALRAEHCRWGQSVLGIRSRSGHQPVRVKGPVLRLTWRSPEDNVWPPLEQIYPALAQWYPIVATPTETEPDDPEAQLLALAMHGDRLGAIRLAKRLYGLSTTEAKTFVDELTERRR